MSMLARYKKGTGIIELVKLIEDSAEPKRTQLLQMIRSEDPEFAARVEERLFSYENLKTLPENVLAEIIGMTPPRFVALALVGETAEFLALCEKCLGKNFNAYKLEKENYAAAVPTVAQIESGRRKLIAEARKLEIAGQIKLPFSEAGTEAGAPIQAATGTPSPVGAAPFGGKGEQTKSAVTGVGAAPLSSGPAATAEGGCPPIQSFNLDPAPPGLSGERFETFIKTQLK